MFGQKKIALTDEQLVQKYHQTLEKEYVGEFFSRYSTLAYGTCMKYLKNSDHAKDATMEVFEKLIHDLPKYEVQNFKSWLYRVVTNHCLQILRKNTETISFDALYENSGDSIMENEHLVHLSSDESSESTLQLLEKSIEELDAEQRQCVQLFYLQKKSYQEIVNQTGFTANEVKSYLQNGKRNLKLKMLKYSINIFLISWWFCK